MNIKINRQLLKAALESLQLNEVLRDQKEIWRKMLSEAETLEEVKGWAPQMFCGLIDEMLDEMYIIPKAYLSKSFNNLETQPPAPKPHKKPNLELV